MFSAELERKRAVETTLHGEPGWKPSVHELCPALPLPLSLHSPAPAPAGISCSLPMAPSQPHPAEGSNKSLQMWAELIKNTSNVFAFVWQLFSGTTRFCPEKQRFAQISALSQNSVNSGYTHSEQKLQEFSVLSQENRFAVDLFISSAELNPP